MFKRDLYLERLKPMINTAFIKVITGSEGLVKAIYCCCCGDYF
jgi:hypothetical protein